MQQISFTRHHGFNLTQTIKYNSHNRADTIKEGNYKIEITYGADGQRRKTVIKNAGTIEKEITYVGNYEKIKAGSNTYEVHYINSPAGIIAMNIRKNQNTDSLFVVHADHLVSILKLTDWNGNTRYEQSFDPWGRERNPADWSYTFSVGSKPVWLIRGFTSHEHLTEVKLINMNARLYDPLTGRMLSPDNYVQDATSMQGYNRYSYVGNNPIVYTDPSGDFAAIAMWGVSFLGSSLSNVINGYNDPFGRAYRESNQIINSMSSVGQFPVYQGKNTTVTAGLAIFNFGVSVNAQHRSGDFTFTGSAGVGFSGGAFASGNVGYTSGDFQFRISGGVSSNANGGGYSPRYGGGITYYDRPNGQNFSLGLTHYGGSNAQTTWNVGYGNGSFSFSMENDAWISGDKYRTAAAEIGFGNVSYGFNLYTTIPPENEHRDGEGIHNDYRSMWGANRRGTYSSGSRIHAGMYLGYNDGITVSRVGIDAPFVQDFFQNGIHKYVVKGPYFNTTYGAPSGLFFQNFSYYPYSLY